MASDGTGYDDHVDLRRAVATRARVEGDVILVDDFLNHRVEPDLQRAVGHQLAQQFRPLAPDALLTAEASGIPPALSCALELDIPMVYAKKSLGTGSRYTFFREVISPTKGIEYRVEVARRVLRPGSRLAVIDDFLAGGRTAEALGEIAEEAGCEVAGYGFVIEKTFQEGRPRLEKHGWEVHSLVKVTGLANGVISIEQ